MFIPDYSNYDKILQPANGRLQNDITLAKRATSTELSELYSSVHVKQPVVGSIFDNEDLSDQQMFDGCVSRTIQDPYEFAEVYDFNKG